MRCLPFRLTRQLAQRIRSHRPRHRELAPTERPDLATEVRPELDRITTQFIDQLAATEGVRGPTAQCAASLVVSGAETDHRYRLDWLHQRALGGAIRPLCA